MATRRRHFGSVRRLPSGRYQASYWRLAMRLVADDTFTTKGEAQAWLSTVETDIQRGAWVDPAGGKITIADLAARWLESDPSKRSNTKVRDEMAIRLHIVPAMGTCELGQVTPRQVQGLINTWALQRAPGSVRRDYAVLRAMFGYAVESDWLVRSPCRRIKLPAVELPTRPQLSPDEVADLADAVGIREAPIIWIGALLGLRWGEVAGLRVGDVDLLRGTVRVAEQRPAHGPPGPPKSRAGLRALTLPSGLVDLLAAHYAAKGLSAVKHDSLVFTSHDGSPLNYANWRNRVWLPAVKRAGVNSIGFHDLRRTNATQLVLSGVDVKTVQTRLGHADPRVTLAVYAQAVSHADQDAAGRLDERFFGSRTDRARRRSG